MATDFELTFLGTGTSVGVPVIGCDCPVCTSADRRNRRTRSSIHLRMGDTQLLIDSGPDLREQALREGICQIDAVLYTHGHVDHVAGFDELRAFCWRRESPLPMHGSRETLNTLRQMFGWAFSPKNIYRGYVKPQPIEFVGPIHFGPLRITPLPVEHGGVETHGFLFELPGRPSLAYIPDAKRIPEATRQQIHGVHTLIIDALRRKPHPTHMTVEEALSAIAESGAIRAYLTHLSHEIEHGALSATLPAHVHIAHDGLQIGLS